MNELSVDHRVKFLEQQVLILQKEAQKRDALLEELGMVLEGITNGNSMAFQVFDDRIRKLEIPIPTSGVEL